MKTTTLAALAFALAAPAMAATPASPACALLTDEETAKFLGGTAPTLLDGGPETAGTSSCSWVASAGGMIGIQVMTPSAFGTTPDAYYDLMVGGVQNSGQKTEPVEGVGKKAMLIADPASTNFVVLALVGEKLLSLTTMSVPHDTALAIGKAAAGRM